MNRFFYIILLIIFLTNKVFANNYICDAWTNTLTLEKDKVTFTASIESGTLNLRSSNNLPKEIPKFSKIHSTTGSHGDRRMPYNVFWGLI